MQASPARPRHLLPVRIYYEDTDFSGAVYHANYLRFFERARTEFLRELGADHLTLFAKEGVGFVVRSLEIDYRRPARMDDLLRVETQIERLGRASIDLEQALWRDAEALTVAKIRLALVAGGRPRPVPAELYAKIDSFRTAAGPQDPREPNTNA